MSNRPFAQLHTRRVLVSVTNAREVIRAGFGGARLTVRTLDQISCHVHAGELLTLRGSVASGALSLLRALHGTSPRIRAEHRSVPHVQLRRATISALAARSIDEGWRDVRTKRRELAAVDAGSPHCVREAQPGPRSPVVYLLRVRSPRVGERPPVSPLVDTPQSGAHVWREWAQQVRDAGGAVVLAVQTPLADSRPAPPHAKTRPTNRGTRFTSMAVREGAGASGGNIRTLTLHAGQFINADPDETLPC